MNQKAVKQIRKQGKVAGRGIRVDLMTALMFMRAQPLRRRLSLAWLIVKGGKA